MKPYPDQDPTTAWKRKVILVDVQSLASQLMSYKVISYKCISNSGMFPNILYLDLTNFTNVFPSSSCTLYWEPLQMLLSLNDIVSC